MACCIFRDTPKPSDCYITDQRWLSSQRCSAQQEARREGEEESGVLAGPTRSFPFKFDCVFVLRGL